MKSKKLVFLGSGDLGLDALLKLKSEFQIELVVTKPKPAKHKGSMPVYDYCLENNLNIITPNSKSELDSSLIPFLDQHPDIKAGVVVDYGIIISEDVILKFSLGIINSHFSILPKWRGADPITFPLLAGDESTGVSFMIIDKGMDTGEVIKTFELEIAPDDDQLSLTNKLSQLSCSKLNSIVNKLLDHDSNTEKQPKHLITYSRMLGKQESVLNPNKPASLIEREVRAFQDWPKTKLKVAGIECIVKKARALKYNNQNARNGQVVIEGEQIKLYCGRGSCLVIEELQPLSKKSMKSADFIRGYVN